MQKQNYIKNHISGFMQFVFMVLNTLQSPSASQSTQQFQALSVLKPYKIFTKFHILQGLPFIFRNLANLVLQSNTLQDAYPTRASLRRRDLDTIKH